MEYELKVYEMLCPNKQLPIWSKNKVIGITDIRGLEFYTTKKVSTIISINPNIITGTTHDSYNKGTWLDMLANLDNKGKGWKNTTKKRVYRVISERIDADCLPLISKYGNEYLIDDDGNHRCCYAKFLGFESISVSLTEFIFDSKLYEMNNYLLSLNFKFNKTDLINGVQPLVTIQLGSQFIHIDRNCISEFIQFYLELKPDNFWDLLKKHNPFKSNIEKLTLKSIEDFSKVQQLCKMFKFQ